MSSRTASPTFTLTDAIDRFLHTVVYLLLGLFVLAASYRYCVELEQGWLYVVHIARVAWYAVAHIIPGV